MADYPAGSTHQVGSTLDTVRAHRRDPVGGLFVAARPVLRILQHPASRAYLRRGVPVAACERPLWVRVSDTFRRPNPASAPPPGE